MNALSKSGVWLLALVAGVGVPLSLAPFDLWPLGCLAVAAQLVLLRRCAGERSTGRQTSGGRQSRTGAFAIGYWFGLGKYGLGASWVYVSIHQFGHASPALAALLVALFVGILGSFNAAMAWGWWRWLARPGVYGDLAFAGCWVLLDGVLTWLLTGFPWLYLGYGHLDTWLGGYAPVVGVHGVTLAAAFIGIALTWFGWPRRAERAWSRPSGAAITAAAMALVFVVGYWLGKINWVQPAHVLNVALVQGNIPQDTKWDDRYIDQTLQRYVTLSDGVWDRDLILWPEAAVTLLLDDARPFLNAMGGRAAKSGGALVTGIVSWRPEEGVRNLAVVVGNGDGTYVKRHLVPFGEYVPMEGLLRGLIGFFDLPMSHTTSGAADQPLLRVGETRIAMAICYEIVYPDLVRDLGARADLLVTISNDTWFGSSIGPLQHMQMAQMRAKELGRWLLRGTNNGVTAVVNANGDIVARLPQFVPATLRAQVWTMSGATPFASFGSTPALLGAAVLAAAGRRARRAVDVAAAL